MKEIICGIYKITSPSGKVYIGQSKDIKTRWRDYKNLKDTVECQTKLYRSFIKYSPKAHTFEIKEECLFEDLDCRERYWQDEYDVLNRDKGLNLALQNCGDKKKEVSDETRERLRKAGIGRIQSDETKKLIGESSLGRIHNEEAREKNRQWHLGKKLTEESIRKRSLTNSKIILNTETGIFYIGIKEAAESANINISTLRHKLSGYSKNNTPFIYV